MGKKLRFDPFPRFLGVTLDRTLSFRQHVDRVSARAAQKSKILQAVAHSSWGWRKQDLRKVYISHIRSVLHYAGAGWQPFLHDQNIKVLERAQNRCLRIITSQTTSTPFECLRAESGIPSMRSTVEASCMRSREKALRLPDDHPRRLSFSDPPPIPSHQSI